MASQTRAFDERLAAALDDVAVPAGLRERLLDRLRLPDRPCLPAGASDPAPAVPADPVPAIPAAPAPAPLLPQPVAQSVPAAVEPASVPFSRRLRVGRRWWLAAAAAAAGLALAGRWWLLADRADGDVAQLAAAWQQRLTSTWQSTKTLPSGFRVPQSVAVAPRRWQALDRLAGVRGVAWDLSRPGFARAVLFVARMTSAGLPNSPPAAPQSTTGGQTIAGWQSGGLVYLLVVEGDVKDYRRLIHLSVEQMA